MQRGKSHILAVIIVTVWVIVGLSFVVHNVKKTSEAIVEGEQTSPKRPPESGKATAFALQSYKGDTWSLEYQDNQIAIRQKTENGQEEILKDQFLILHFLPPGCPIYCQVRAVEQLKKLDASYKNKGLLILEIFRDHDVKKWIEPYMKVNSPPWPLLRDISLSVVKQYPVSPTPRTAGFVIVDRHGNIRWKQVGFNPGDEKRFEETIQQILAKKG